MTVPLNRFIEKINLLTQVEINKVRLLAFYYHNEQDEFEFTVDSVCEWFEELGLHKPNKSRLKDRLSKSRSFVRGKERNYFRLHASDLQFLRKDYSFVGEKSEEIETTDTILPASLYENTRGYIESLSKQVNASYENNIFDGCAVLMRRLLEICLILSYKHQEINTEIRDSSGNYKMLSDIVSNAVNNPKLSLSRDTKSCLEKFRIIGNYSAHRIHYNAKRADIQKVILEYRAVIEELLYKNGIKK